MQKKNITGQQEDWELSEAYYKEEDGKKELRLEDFLEPEEAPENQSGLSAGTGIAGQLEEMSAQDNFRSFLFPLTDLLLQFFFWQIFRQSFYGNIHATPLCTVCDGIQIISSCKIIVYFCHTSSCCNHPAVITISSLQI